MVVFAHLHQLTKKNFISEVSYIFQGKHVLLANDSSELAECSLLRRGDAAEHAKYVKKALIPQR